METSPVVDVVARFEQPLLRYATRIVGDRERAREVVQDTFLRLFEANRDDDEKLAGWLYTVCRNRAIDVRRRERRRVPVAQLPDAGVEGMAEARRTVSEVLSAIDALPDKERSILRRRYADGDSYRDIGDSMGLSTGSVGFSIHRALNTVRGRLGVALSVFAIIVGLALYGGRPMPTSIHRPIFPAPPVVPTLDQQPVAAPSSGPRMARPTPQPSSSVAPSGAPSAASSAEKVAVEEKEDPTQPPLRIKPERSRRLPHPAPAQRPKPPRSVIHSL